MPPPFTIDQQFAVVASRKLEALLEIIPSVHTAKSATEEWGKTFVKALTFHRRYHKDSEQLQVAFSRVRAALEVHADKSWLEWGREFLPKTDAKTQASARKAELHNERAGVLKAYEEGILELEELDEKMTQIDDLMDSIDYEPQTPQVHPQSIQTNAGLASMRDMPELCVDLDAGSVTPKASNGRSAAGLIPAATSDPSNIINISDDGASVTSGYEEETDKGQGKGKRKRICDKPLKFVARPKVEGNKCDRCTISELCEWSAIEGKCVRCIAQRRMCTWDNVNYMVKAHRSKSGITIAGRDDAPPAKRARQDVPTPATEAGLHAKEADKKVVQAKVAGSASTNSHVSDDPRANIYGARLVVEESHVLPTIDRFIPTSLNSWRDYNGPKVDAHTLNLLIEMREEYDRLTARIRHASEARTALERNMVDLLFPQK